MVGVLYCHYKYALKPVALGGMEFMIQFKF